MVINLLFTKGRENPDFNRFLNHKSNPSEVMHLKRLIVVVFLSISPMQGKKKITKVALVVNLGFLKVRYSCKMAFYGLCQKKFFFFF